MGMGLVLALLLGRTMKAFLVGISPFDPLTFAAVAILLTTIALAASYLPARRAAGMDPVTALREE
jgi:ABC-type antimicrobial peptide transport system permease subunit